METVEVKLKFSHKLSTFIERGTPLSSVADTESDYHFLVSEICVSYQPSLATKATAMAPGPVWVPMVPPTLFTGR